MPLFPGEKTRPQIDGEALSSLQPENVPVHRFIRFVALSIRQEPRNRRRIWRKVNTKTAESLNLRSEAKAGRSVVVIKRFDAGAVGGGKENVLFQIQNGHRPHAVEFFETGFSPDFVCLKHYFGVRSGGEHATQFLEFLPEREVVVHFAVVIQNEGLVRIGHRLVTFGFRRNDGQTAVQQSNRTRLRYF